MLLLLFGGAIGLHKFYEGKIGLGILYIVLTLSIIGTIVTFIGIFIDFVLILCKPEYYE